jgi:hypothetical protein
MAPAPAKRFWSHAFVLPGGLALFWGILAWLYVAFLRVPERTTGDDPVLACSFGEILSDGACTSPVWAFLLMIIVGGALVLLGALLFRVPPRTPEDRLRIGAGTRFWLAALLSLFVVPLAYGLSALGRLGDPATEEWVRFGPSAYDAMPFLFGAAAAGLVAFSSALGIHLFHMSMRRRYLHALRRQGPPQEPRHRHDPLRDSAHATRVKSRVETYEPGREAERGSLPRVGYRWESV